MNVGAGGKSESSGSKDEDFTDEDEGDETDSGGVGSGTGGVGGGDKKNKIHVFQKKGSTSQSNASDFTQVSAMQCIDCEKDAR